MSSKVIVRGMTKKWFSDHFISMEVYFGGNPKAVPTEDSKFVGFYLEAPVSAITHIGIVDRVERTKDHATFYLKAIIKLDEPVKTKDSHAIRKQEYWTLEELGIKQVGLIFNDFAIAKT